MKIKAFFQKTAALTVILLTVFLFSGCENDGDGITVPLGILPYTDQGTDGKSSMTVRVRYYPEQYYGYLWFGVKKMDQETPYWIPVENIPEMKASNRDVWWPKSFIRIDNKINIQNKWAFEDTLAYDIYNNVAGANNLTPGFHHLEIYTLGFKHISMDINLKPGENFFDLIPETPYPRQPNYYYLVSGLVYSDEPLPPRVYYSSRRFINFPVRVYFGDFASVRGIPEFTSYNDYPPVYSPALRADGSNEVTSYTEIENEAEFLKTAGIYTPASYVSEKMRASVINALNKWASACDKLSFVYTDSPEEADISYYWVRRSDLGTGTAGLTVAVDPKYNANGFYSHKPVIFLPVDDIYTGTGMVKDAMIDYLSLHETGHALGLWGHSYSEGDIMYQSLNKTQTYFLPEAELSYSDINTINILYEVDPVYTNLPVNNYLQNQDGSEFWKDLIK